MDFVGGDVGARGRGQRQRGADGDRRRYVLPHQQAEARKQRGRHSHLRRAQHEHATRQLAQALHRQFQPDGEQQEHDAELGQRLWRVDIADEVEDGRPETPTSPRLDDLEHDSGTELRLAGGDPNVQFANRAHFFAAAAEAMRRILIERARRKSAKKHGGDWRRIDLDKVEIATDADDDTLLLVNEALEKLAQEDARAAEIAKLRFFGGLTMEEAGRVLGVTDRTAKSYWAFARAWLFDEMRQALSR